MTDTFLRSSLQQARGVIGRYPDPGDRYIFLFDDVQDRTISMIGVTNPLKSAVAGQRNGQGYAGAATMDRATYSPCRRGD
jgi:hypothetical protein